MGNMIDIFSNSTPPEAEDDFPDFREWQEERKALVKKDPIIDPCEFGGEDFPNSVEEMQKAMKERLYGPIVTPEEEKVIKKFYEEHPSLKQESNPNVFMKPVGKDPFYEEEAWIQTYSGRRFNPTFPHVDAIVIQDIAHSLSMQCRFSGHCKKFYSVAQHSVLVSYICDRADALWGLMHDASEAYLVDIPRPLKQSGDFESYKRFEAQMMRAICKRFKLPDHEPPSVKDADNLLLCTEARDLMSPLRTDWVQNVDPLPFKIIPWSQQEAKNNFMKRFFELTGCDHYHYQHYLEQEEKS